MTHLRTFIFLIALAFGLPWLLLIVYPHTAFRSLAPVQYAENELEVAEGTVFPPGVAGRVSAGHEIYGAEGCAYCHTQMLRPIYSTSSPTDMWRAGWAGRGPDWAGAVGKPAPFREPRPEDYLDESFAFLGLQRHGSDLSNLGWRRSASELHRVLYSPRSIDPGSNMPAYRHLYDVRRIGGAPSQDAVQLEGPGAPPEGYEVVPTKEANALVSYLLSLKKDYRVPASNGGPPVVAQPAVAAPAATPAPATKK